METVVAINKRRSVRDYTDKPIPKQLLEQIVECALKAPSARGVDPWEFIIVADKRILTTISELAPNGAFLSKAFCAIIVACKDTKYYLEDGCAATENMLLAACDSGLGACWIAGDKKPYREEILGILKAPKGMRLVSIISLGWPKEDLPEKERRSLSDALHWEKY